MQAEREIRYVALGAIWLFALFTATVALLYLRDRRRAGAGPALRGRAAAQ